MKSLAIALLITVLPGLPLRATEPSAPAPPSVTQIWADYDPNKGDFKEEIVKEETKNGAYYRESYISACVVGEEIRIYCQYKVKAGAKSAPGLLNVHGWMGAPHIDNDYVTDGWAVMTYDYCGQSGQRAQFTKYPEKLSHCNMDKQFGIAIHSTLHDGKSITDPKQTSNYVWYAMERRVLSYLEQQKEVDKTRLGAKGYSYGGTLMWPLAGTDRRIKAAVAYFGIGWLEYYRNKQVWLYNNPAVEPQMSPGEKIYLAGIAPQAYVPHITAPMLFLNGSNDHHGQFERGLESFKLFKKGVPWAFAVQVRGHHNTDKIEQDCKMWLEKYVLNKEVFWPAHPKSAIQLDAEGVPELMVTPASPERVKRVEMYYAQKNPECTTRSWRDMACVKDGEVWTGKMPVLNTGEYVFGYANIIYDTTVVLSTDFNAVIPSKLGNAKATDNASDAIYKVPLMPRMEDYTLMWWADGTPKLLNSETPLSTGILCMQSGGWGMAFDTKNVRMLRCGKWAAPMGIEKAMSPGRASLKELSPVAWNCAVVADGQTYNCVGHVETKDWFLAPIRFVESGRFFQRVVIEGLKFADGTGREFPCVARLEISAWPDRLALRVEIEPKNVTAESELRMQAGSESVTTPLIAKTTVQLIAVGDRARAQPGVESDPAIKVVADEALGCRTLELPDERLSNSKGTFFPEEHLDDLDRFRFTLRNDSDQPTVARLMFTRGKNLNLCGFTPMLCEPDGTPSGLPVQISKDWHQRAEKGAILHQGPWFHGCSFVRLAPHSKRELVFQMVYARYGGVFAASHAQLSLIGWGANQFWDESAIGGFGESICFEPGRVQRRCFIDDIRPLMTLPQGTKAKPWGWADNCGGGDCLMWQNEQGTYQPMVATRTDYRAYGPCLTYVRYTEESAGGELAASMAVSVPRSDDYLRTFFHIRYDVQKPMKWRRLAFFQLGSDFYNDVPARVVAIGNSSGLGTEWEPKLGKDVYDRSAVPLAGEQPWISIHGQSGAIKLGTAMASRGLIVRLWRATLGGEPAPQPYASTYCTEWGKDNNRTAIELSPPPGVAELLPGDFVEADLELVVFPADAAAYYGPSKAFQKRLSLDANNWRLVQQEAVGNALKAVATKGRVIKSYPLVITSDAGQQAEVSFRGGLGYLPVTFSGLSCPDGYNLTMDGQRVDQSVHGNDFWQTDYNATTRQWSRTYNVPIRESESAHTLLLEPKPAQIPSNPAKNI